MLAAGLAADIAGYRRVDPAWFTSLPVSAPAAAHAVKAAVPDEWIVRLSARGKSPPGLFPGMKTSGFTGAAYPGSHPCFSSRLFLDSLLSESSQARVRSVADAARFLGGTAAGVEVVCGLGLSGQMLGRATIPGVDVGTALRGVTGVSCVAANSVRSLSATPNDPSCGQLYGLNNVGRTGGTADADIDAAEARDVTTGSSATVVGIVDTGIDWTHPDLVANVWTNPGEIPGNGVDDDHNGSVDDVHGYDFANGDGNPMDDHGHGTHVSGTIGAGGNNGVGVVGVNWNVSLMDFGFFQRNAIYGRLVEDIDGGGTADAGEPPIANQRVFDDVNGNGVYDTTPLVVASGTVNRPIRDFTITIGSLVVGGEAQQRIVDLTVSLTISHTWDSDLLVDLVAPDGTTITLADHRGHDGDNFTSTHPILVVVPTGSGLNGPAAGRWFVPLVAAGVSFNNDFALVANRAPTDVGSSAATIPGNSPAGTVVGTLRGVDPDIGDPQSFSLVDGAGSGDNASFTIVAGRIRSQAVFNFEARSSYSIRVRTTDAGGLSFEPSFGGGSLTVALVAGGLVSDRLLVQSRGTDPGQIAVSGSSITWVGTAIGSWSGGTGTTSLVIALKAAATPDAVQALLRSVAFTSVAVDPTNGGATAARTIRYTPADAAVAKGVLAAVVTQTPSASRT